MQTNKIVFKLIAFLLVATFVLSACGACCSSRMLPRAYQGLRKLPACRRTR